MISKFILFKPYAGLPGSVYVLFTARIINRMGDFVKMFLTLFLTQKLGMSVEMTGLFVAASGWSSLLGALGGGYLGDHLSRKKTLLVVQTMSGFLIFLCGFLGASVAIPYLLIASQLFNGAARPINQAMVTDLTKGEARQKAFSLLYLGINLGVAIGPLLAGFLFKHYIRWIFWGDGLTTLLAVVLVLFMVPETKPSNQEIEESVVDRGNPERAEQGSAISAFFKRPFLVAFVFLSLLYTFIYSQHSFTLPLQLKELFGQDSARQFGFIMSANALVVLGLTTFLVHFTRKIKPVINVAVAILFCAVGFGMLRFTRTLELFLFSTLLWTIGEILAHTYSQVYRAHHTPINQRGRFNGLIRFITGQGSPLSHAVTGFLVLSLGVARVWTVIFFLGLVLAAAFYGLYLLERRKTGEHAADDP